MSRIATLGAAACLALAGCGDARPRATPAPRGDPTTVRTSLERTAVWVGDPITYTIEVLCGSGYDIVESDLGRDHLQLTGLEVQDADIEREVRDGGAVAYRARYRLVSYAAETENLRIGPRSLRYYGVRDDGTMATDRPAGTAKLPGEDLMLRSALPETADLTVRATRPPALLARSARLLAPLGLTLVVLSLLVAATAAAGPLMRRSRPVRPVRPAPRPATDYRLALDEIRRLEAGGDEAVLRQAFERLDRLLRERAADAGVDARSLTPDEMDRGPGSMSDPARAALTRALRACERVRYGGPRQAPSRDLLAQVLSEAEAALAPAEGPAR